MPIQVFISYRRSDQRSAEHLHRLLHDRGVSSWYDALIDAGDDWRAAVTQALVAAPIFVLLFSRNASESDEIVKELAAATFQKKTIVPVRLENLQPEGAFLYELASRNWFDAFVDREARLALLADRLAAMTRKGTAASGNVDLPPESPQRSGVARKPSAAKIGAIGFVVIALLVSLAVYFGRRETAAPRGAAPTQRIAFFGFEAADDDPVTRRIATQATEEAVAALARRRVDIVRGDLDQDGDATARLAAATALGARYALGGEVRRDEDVVRVVLRTESVESRATLWQTTLDTHATTPVPAANDAADTAVNFANCLMNSLWTSDRPPPNEEAAALVASACDAWQRRGAADQVATFLQELVAKGYAGPDADAALVANFSISLGDATPSQREARLQQARDAAARAEKTRPHSFATARARSVVALVGGDPPLRYLPQLEADLKRMPVPAEAYWYARASQSAGFGMWAAGRLRAARLYFATARNIDPSYVVAADAAVAAQSGVTEAGQTRSPYEQFLEALRSRRDEFVWESALAATLLYERGDAEAIFALVPPGASQDGPACYRTLQAALKLNGAARRAAAPKVEACLTDFDSPHIVAQAATLLGDLDTAFAQFDTLEKANSLTLSYFPPWFSPATRALRADPRFLPLMAKLGFMEYWKQTKTRPDVCETPAERDIPICRELRAD